MIQQTMHEILEETRELEKALIEYELMLIDSEGELTPEIVAFKEQIDELAAINHNNAVQKLEAYYYVIEHIKSKAEFEKQQEQRFARRRKALESSSERLKGIVDYAMTKYGIDDPKSKGAIPSKKLSTPTVDITAVAYPIIDPSTIPPVDKLEEEVSADLLEYNTNIKVKFSTKQEAQEAIPLLSKFAGQDIVIPPSLKTDKVKEILKAKGEVGEMKLISNFKSRFK